MTVLHITPKRKRSSSLVTIVKDELYVGIAFSSNSITAGQQLSKSDDWFFDFKSIFEFLRSCLMLDFKKIRITFLLLTNHTTCFHMAHKNYDDDYLGSLFEYNIFESEILKLNELRPDCEITFKPQFLNNISGWDFHLGDDPIVSETHHELTKDFASPFDVILNFTTFKAIKQDYTPISLHKTLFASNETIIVDYSGIKLVTTENVETLFDGNDWLFDKVCEAFAPIKALNILSSMLISERVLIDSRINAVSNTNLHHNKAVALYLFIIDTYQQFATSYGNDYSAFFNHLYQQMLTNEYGNSFMHDSEKRYIRLDGTPLTRAECDAIDNSTSASILWFQNEIELISRVIHRCLIVNKIFDYAKITNQTNVALVAAGLNELSSDRVSPEKLILAKVKTNPNDYFSISFFTERLFQEARPSVIPFSLFDSSLDELEEHNEFNIEFEHTEHSVLVRGFGGIGTHVMYPFLPYNSINQNAAFIDASNNGNMFQGRRHDINRKWKFVVFDDDKIETHNLSRLPFLASTANKFKWKLDMMFESATTSRYVSSSHLSPRLAFNASPKCLDKIETAVVLNKTVPNTLASNNETIPSHIKPVTNLIFRSILSDPKASQNKELASLFAVNGIASFEIQNNNTDLHSLVSSYDDDTSDVIVSFSENTIPSSNRSYRDVDHETFFVSSYIEKFMLSSNANLQLPVIKDASTSKLESFSIQSSSLVNSLNQMYKHARDNRESVNGCLRRLCFSHAALLYSNESHDLFMLEENNPFKPLSRFKSKNSPFRDEQVFYAPTVKAFSSDPSMVDFVIPSNKDHWRFASVPYAEKLKNLERLSSYQTEPFQYDSSALNPSFNFNHFTISNPTINITAFKCRLNTAVFNEITKFAKTERAHTKPAVTMSLKAKTKAFKHINLANVLDTNDLEVSSDIPLELKELIQSSDIFKASPFQSETLEASETSAYLVAAAQYTMAGIYYDLTKKYFVVDTIDSITRDTTIHANVKYNYDGREIAITFNPFVNLGSVFNTSEGNGYNVIPSYYTPPRVIGLINEALMTYPGFIESALNGKVAASSQIVVELHELLESVYSEDTFNISENF
jgi:hypothetical protein